MTMQHWPLAAKCKEDARYLIRKGEAEVTVNIVMASATGERKDFKITMELGGMDADRRAEELANKLKKDRPVTLTVSIPPTSGEKGFVSLDESGSYEVTVSEP